MPSTTENIKIPYPVEGIIRSSQLDDTVTPENSAQIAVNMNFDRIGAIQTRPGITTYTTTLGGSIMNFGTLSLISGTKWLYAQVGTDISNWNGAVWTSRRTLTTAANKARFDQFLNQIWMVNGNATALGDPVQISNGGAFVNPVTVFTNLTNPLPPGDFISTGFEGRVWIADSATDIVYYSDIVQFTPPLTFNLSFAPLVNFIKNFSPQDGETITGLIRVPRALLMFKQNHIYRIYGALSVDAYPAYNVGTYSNESLVQTKDGVYFHHSSGFYKFTYDSQPTEISRRVLDFVKAIPRNNYDNIEGIWDGFDNIEWYVGPVTTEGVTYTNCVMRYTISTQVWTIYDYVGNDITAFISYDDGVKLNSIVGTSIGRVGALGTGSTDFGERFYFEYIDRWRSFTDMYSKSKVVSGMMVCNDNAAGTLVEYQINKDTPNEWQYINTVNEDYASLFPSFRSKDFNVFRYRITGQGSTGADTPIAPYVPLVFHGVEILKLTDEGFDTN